MATDLQKTYVAAIALNNIAVSLVERRCYSQAIDVFRDAVSLMREVTATFRLASFGDRACKYLPSTFLSPTCSAKMLRYANWILSHSSSLEESSQETHPTIVVLTEDDTKDEDKKDEEKSKPRSGLLKNMGRKALNRFASMRNVSSSSKGANIGKEAGDHTSPTNSHTSGLDFDYDNEVDADAHLSCHGSKHGKGFQMLG